MTQIQMPRVDLGGDENLLGDLLEVWHKRRPMNARRSVYFDGEAALKDFGISIPPAMRRKMQAALGWSGQGVRAVTNRSEFSGFVLKDGQTDDPLGLDEILEANVFDREFDAAKVSSAVHGCSFATITAGDTAAGEHEVQIIARAAEDSAAIWDRRRRALSGFLAVVDMKDRQPTEMILFTPERIHTIAKTSGKWAVETQDHGLGEVPVVPLPYGYELRRPLGHSRLTRASMYYSDAALRTIARAEVSGELYGARELFIWGPGVSELIGSDKWKAMMGRIKALDLEPGDEKPEMKVVPGASPEPYVAQLRMLANLFADDQDLDVKFADSSNPTSADAIFAAKETLITTTRKANRDWAHAATRIARLAVRLREGLDQDTPEMLQLRAMFVDPAIVSPSARAASFVQLAGQIQGFADTEVGLEYAGLDRETIQRFMAERRRSTVGQLVDVIRAGEGTTPALPPADGAEGATELAAAQAAKAKLDALGVGIRAGADPEDVAARVGLPGIRFTGATPVNLRLPKEDATDLEAK